MPCVTKRNVGGALVGAVLGLLLASGLVTTLNTTAATSDDLVGRGTLLVLLVWGGLGGLALGALFSD
jgi:hypothetical protein